MCYSATCPTCSKKSWRGCGNHIPSAMGSAPEDQWCTCEPKVTINGKAYPPAAAFQMPGTSWLSGVLKGGKKEEKEESKEQAQEES